MESSIIHGNWPSDKVAPALALAGDYETRLWLREQAVDEMLRKLTQDPAAFCLSVPGGWCLAATLADGSQLLAADRVGLRDLYYTQHAGTVYYAEHIKDFRKIPGWSTGTDHARVCEYMAYRRIAGRHTMYTNVDRVEPGTYVCFRAGSCEPSIQRYWTYHWDVDDGLRFADAQQQLKDGLIAAGQQMQAAGVAPFCMLSGGVDSAAALWAMRQVQPDMPVVAATIYPDVASCSEWDDAQRIARHLGAQAEPIRVTADTLLAHLDHVHAVLEQPVVHTIACLHDALFAAMAERGFGSFVTGEAADTLFGYDRFARYHWIWAHGSPLRDAGMRMLAAAGWSKARLWAGLTGAEWRRFVCMGRRYFDDGVLRSVVRDYAPQDASRLAILEQADAGTRLEQVSHFYFATFIQDCRIFGALGAARGLEACFPFVHSAIRELALGLPPAYKFKGMSGKYLLKAAMDPVLPSGVAWGRKRSGEQPLGKWMREHAGLRERVMEACGAGASVAEYFETEALGRLVREHMEGTSDHSVLLWQVVSLEGWLQGVERRA